MILYGADYYPEQWPDSVMDDDLRLMREMHVNTVTLGVFSWDKMQSDEGVYHLSWLERVMNRLHENGIGVCLATPTSGPPFWMTNRHPEMLRTTIEGVRMMPGARANFCPNHPKYKEFSSGIVEALAKRLGGHPALKLWHINNEYEFTCYCPECTKAFRQWLREKYDTIDALNISWCTNFWSHTYQDFELIDPPSYLNEIKPHMLAGRDIACFQGMDLDYNRFMSRSVERLIESEATILRSYSKVPVTNNFAGLHKTFDLRKLAEPLDVISWDNYPTIKTPAWVSAFTHDLMRSIKHKPYLTLEQTPNHILWRDYLPSKRPQEVSRLAWQGVAHGSNAVMFFQWRQSRGGAEMLHGAMVPHSGQIDTRMGRELTKLGADLEKLHGEIEGIVNAAQVGIVFTWDSWWALESSATYNNALRYDEAVLAYYRVLWEMGVKVEVISTDDDLSPYSVVVAPYLYLCPQEFAEVLSKFAWAGGTVVSSCLTGIVDEHASAVLGGYPGWLRRLFGLWVEETDGLYPDMSNSVEYTGSVYKAEAVCDIIRLEGAAVLARYREDFYCGTPCVTENHYGSGRAIYIGTVLEPACMKAILSKALKEKNIETFDLQPGVERAVRGHYTFFINHSGEPQTISLSGREQELTTDAANYCATAIGPGETRIFRTEEKSKA